MNPSGHELVELELLLLRCRRGDREALGRLIRANEQPLYYFDRRIVGSDADAWDVMKQMWVRVLRGIAGVRDAAGLKAWLYRVARNTALNHLRAEQRHQAAITKKLEQPSSEECEQEFSVEDAEAVHAALDKIELPFREALTLYFLEDLSIRQMAEILDIPEGTIKSRLFHGRQKLRAILEKSHE